MSDSQEITPDDVGTLAPVDESMAAFAEYAKGLRVEDPEAVQERILKNLLTATTAHDILHAGEAMPAADLFGVPIEVQGLRASESTYADGPDFYLHIDAKVIGNGDKVTFSCSARDVVMKLIRLDQLGMLPMECKLERATKATAEGFFPVFLRELADADKSF